MLMLVSTSSNTGNVPNTKNSSALFLKRAPSKFRQRILYQKGGDVDHCIMCHRALDTLSLAAWRRWDEMASHCSHGWATST